VLCLRRLIVRSIRVFAAFVGGCGFCLAGCENTPAPPSSSTKAAVTAPPTPTATEVRVEAGPDAPKKAQAALIYAKPGDSIVFGEGRFEFRSTLSLDTSGVTVKGQGPAKTILSFKEQGQGTGGEGLLITSKSDVTLSGLAVEDPKGDGIKANGTNRLVVRDVRVEWTGGPKETNGGYGIYPVLCTDVVIEGCNVQGASDAGIYVGQSRNIVVRRNIVEKNVAGIEIENSTHADVYDNVATNNSGGILVFTMPDLPTKDGRGCRVYQNKVFGNNHDNFAPKGNIVATVPPGTGVMIMANDEVEVFDNTIENNQTGGLSIVSYLLSGKPLKDEKYDPYCESIHIHNNVFKGNGTKPSGAIGDMLTKALGSPLPDILYDGDADPKKLVDGKLPANLAIHIHDNGEAGFVNFDAPALAAAAGGSGKAPKIDRDLKAYAGVLPNLEPVAIKGLE
jgi:parallel beta-helix repeat protein